MGFFVQYAYLVVLAVSLVVWGGMYFYLYRMDKRLQKMEKENI